MALTPLTASWKWTEETFWGLQSYALGTVYSHKMSSWLQLSAGLSVEKYIYTACICILCSIKLSGFLPLDMFQFKTYNYQHSWVSEKMCFVKCKSHIGLHKKMNTMSFWHMDSFQNVRKNQMLRQVQIQSQLGALYFSYGFANLLGSNDLGKVQGQNCYPVDCLQVIRTHKSWSHIL